MRAKATRLLNTLAAASLFASVSRALPQSDEPRTDKQLKDPAVLAAALTDSKASKPVIFNIGPVQQIKGAIAIGPTSAQANLDKLLKKQLTKLPKDKEVIIYCGCCPFRRCPNVRPAFELLKQMKFTNAKLLNLPTSLNDDWISKGYPME
jgi:thiosulfate/3-mercaptopyruvate sulfurtransferase